MLQARERRASCDAPRESCGGRPRRFPRGSGRPPRPRLNAGDGSSEHFWRAQQETALRSAPRPWATSAQHAPRAARAGEAAGAAGDVQVKLATGMPKSCCSRPCRKEGEKRMAVSAAVKRVKRERDGVCTRASGRCTASRQAYGGNGRGAREEIDTDKKKQQGSALWRRGQVHCARAGGHSQGRGAS